jgi:integrase/recombinase XerD
MLKSSHLLKHRILVGLLYGCGLRCLEARSVRLQDLDFDRKQLRVVQGKGKKDRYVPLSEHLIRGLKAYINAEIKLFMKNIKLSGQVRKTVRSLNEIVTGAL